MKLDDKTEKKTNKTIVVFSLSFTTFVPSSFFTVSSISKSERDTDLEMTGYSATTR